MIRFTCDTVYGGWPDVADPDDIDAMLDLGQTKHKFHPALRKLVFLYDAIVDKREAVYTIDLGGSMKVSAKNANDDLVEMNLGPVRFIAERDRP